MRRPKVITKKLNRGWFWEFIASNGKIIAVGGEPFKTKRNAETAARTMVKTAKTLEDDFDILKI